MIAGHKIAKTGTAGADNAALAVEHQDRTQRNRFFKVSFFFIKAAFAGAKLQGIDLAGGIRRLGRRSDNRADG